MLREQIIYNQIPNINLIIDELKYNLSIIYYDEFKYTTIRYPEYKWLPFVKTNFKLQGINIRSIENAIKQSYFDNNEAYIPAYYVDYLIDPKDKTPVLYGNEFMLNLSITDIMSLDGLIDLSLGIRYTQNIISLVDVDYTTIHEYMLLNGITQFNLNDTELFYLSSTEIPIFEENIDSYPFTLDNSTILELYSEPISRMFELNSNEFFQIGNQDLELEPEDLILDIGGNIGSYNIEPYKTDIEPEFVLSGNNMQVKSQKTEFNVLISTKIKDEILFDFVNLYYYTYKEDYANAFNILKRMSMHKQNLKSENTYIKSVRKIKSLEMKPLEM